MSEWLPIVGPIFALMSSVIVAVLVYRSGMKGNAVAEQAGIATKETASIGQVVSGLNTIIAALQADNEVLRQQNRDLRLERRARNGIP